ncbi:hypothetical protein LY76DRAFT_169197 [Colletotrichum caudatum]|nr:hypothetical protein LY76DRAFT_169197 [Colletotrichum caudatum]
MRYHQNRPAEEETVAHEHTGQQGTWSKAGQYVPIAGRWHGTYRGTRHSSPMSSPAVACSAWSNLSPTAQPNLPQHRTSRSERGSTFIAQRSANPLALFVSGHIDRRSTEASMHRTGAMVVSGRMGSSPCILGCVCFESELLSMNHAPSQEG